MIQHHRVAVFSIQNKPQLRLKSNAALSLLRSHLHSKAAELELVKENVAHNVPLIATLFRETVFFSFFFLLFEASGCEIMSRAAFKSSAAVNSACVCLPWWAILRHGTGELPLMPSRSKRAVVVDA